MGRNLVGVSKNFSEEQVKTILGENKKLLSMYSKGNLDTDIKINYVLGEAFGYCPKYLGYRCKTPSIILDLVKLLEKASGKITSFVISQGYNYCENVLDENIISLAVSSKDFLFGVNLEKNGSSLRFESYYGEEPDLFDNFLSDIIECVMGIINTINMKLGIPLMSIEYWCIYDSEECYCVYDSSMKGSKGSYIGFSQSVRENGVVTVEPEECYYVSGEYVLAFVEVV